MLANRAYQIADRFRVRGVPVVLGGIHPTVMPEEAALHADAVCVGEAEVTGPICWPTFVVGNCDRSIVMRPSSLDYRLRRSGDCGHSFLSAPPMTLLLMSGKPGSSFGR